MMINSSIRMNVGSTSSVSAGGSSSKMITDEDWLGDFKFTRSEMNSVVMNYLVTGIVSFYFEHIFCVSVTRISL